jgi:PAS domain S-box-containing protein
MLKSLDEVLVTAELARRPARPPDYEAENRALSAMAEAIVGSPQMILQRLVSAALGLCRADSAGLSILEPGGAAGVFRWHAIAGQFATNTGSYVLREASPSGIVLDRDAALLFSYPERHFDYGMAIDPPIVEALLVPFHTEGKPVGTLWVIAHTPSRKFDTEDQRVLTSLSRFASLSYQVKTAALTAVRVREDVRQILNAAAIGLTRCSRDLRYLACNPAYEKLAGQSAEQIIGRTIMDVIGIEAFEVKRPYIERVLRGEHVEYEEEVPFAAGGRRYLHVVYTPWVERDGQIAGWMASVSDITDLKRTTVALRNSEETLRLAVSSGTIGIWDWDVTTDTATCSSELCEIFGFEVGTARTYEDFGSRVHPEDLAAMEAERDAAIRDHRQFDFEFRIVRSSGEMRWLSARGRGHYDENGRVVRVVGNNIDITERKRLELALRESERRLREALKVAQMGYLDWDLATNEIQWSPETYRLFGHVPGGGFFPTVEVTLGMVPPEDLALVQQRLDAVIRGTAEYDIVHRMARPDGQMIWVHAQGEVMRDKNGTPLRMLATVVDVTERIQAEEALREREQRLRLALDASRAGSWMRDARTGRVDWDDRFREIYGVTAGEPASFEAWLSRVHKEDRRQVLDLWDEIVHTNMDTFDCTFRIVRPDGTVAWIESLGQAHRDVHGQVMRLIGLELDVTERRRAEEALQARRDEERDRAVQKQAEDALRRSHAELQRRALQLRRLASDLTLAEHNAREELARTLHDGLQQLLFSAMMTLDRAGASNSHADLVALLQRARADMNEAMEAARTLSVNLFPPVLNIGGLPVALVWLAKRTQEQYGVVVNVTADPQANPTTRDVRILLFEAVRELLFNAVKHAHVDQVDVKLEVGSDDAIHIQVSDEGIGFDPAVTLHHRHHQQGGLGLFSIEERLSLLGGRLDIQSAPGKGARFSLTLQQSDLPRIARGGAEVRRSDAGWRERLAFDSAAGAAKPLRILIADDHVVARAGLRELFSERPGLWVVGEAANGLEAISKATALQPDVIVMDISMPRMNGIEATREIHGVLPHVQIVGLSTHDDEISERSMREAGAEAYFTKNDGADRLLNYLLSIGKQAKGTAKS